MVSIWEQKVDKEKAAKLPIIIPMVIYHGEDEWHLDPTLAAIVDLENMPGAINSYIPDFTYILYDFSPLSDEEIKGGVKLKIFLEILRSIFAKDNTVFMAALKKAFTAMGELTDQKRGIDYLETLITYIMSARKNIDLGEVYNTVKEVSLEGGEYVILDNIFDLTSLENVEDCLQSTPNNLK